MSKALFIFSTTVFFLFIIQVSGMAGQSIIEGFDASVTVQSSGNFIIDFIANFLNNIGVFLGLMSVNSSFGLFGTVIISAYIVTLLYILIATYKGS